MSTPHDSLFRNVFSDPANAEAMFRGLLGEAIAAQIDWSSLTLRPGTFIDEDLAKRESDVLFSAELAGRPALLYLLFELVPRPRVRPRLPRPSTRISLADLLE